MSRFFKILILPAILGFLQVAAEGVKKTEFTLIKKNWQSIESSDASRSKNRQDILKVIEDLKLFLEDPPSDYHLPEAYFILGKAHQKIALASKDRAEGEKSVKYFKVIDQIYGSTQYRNPSLVAIAEICDIVFADQVCREEAMNKLIETAIPVVEPLQTPSSENITHIHAVKIEMDPFVSGQSIVDIELDRTPQIFSSKFLLPDPKTGMPARYYVDLDKAKVSTTTELPKLSGHGVVSSIRLAQNTHDRARLVLDLSAAQKESDFRLELKGNHVKVFIKPTSLVSEPPIALTKKTIEDPFLGSIPVSSIKNPKKPKYKIVLDPGHGGEDVGAIGHRGTFEKDVCLDISLRLGELLRQNPKYEVFMTRENDKTLALGDRTKFANKIQGDLFVSIHANASPKKTAKGVSTYFLHNADDQESLRVAMRENGELAMNPAVTGASEDHYLEVMKASMVKNFHTIQSTDLARQVQAAALKELKSAYPDVVDLGVRSARFYVLTGAEMPAVLFETSFISNSIEEKRLTDFKYQNTLAKSVVKAIDQFFRLQEKSPAHSGYFRH